MTFNIFSKTLEIIRDLRYSRFTHLFLQKNNYAVSKILHCNDEPIKYSSTRASKMSTEDTFDLKQSHAVLPCERYIILGSLITLFIYIMIRKENKIDKILSGSFDYEENDEIKLVNALLHAKLRGLNTDEIEKKLNEERKRKKKSD